MKIDTQYKIEIYTSTKLGHTLFETLHCLEYNMDGYEPILTIDNNIVYRLNDDCILKITKINYDNITN